MKTANTNWTPFLKPILKPIAATLLAAGLGLSAAQPALAAPAAAAGEGYQRCHSGAGGPDRHGPMGAMTGGDHLLPLLRGMALTETQRDKLFELRHAQEPRQRELMKTVRSTMTSLHELGKTAPYDAQKARTLADSHGKAIADLALLHAEMGAQARELLTPEQRQQADERSARFEQRRGARQDMGRHKRE